MLTFSKSTHSALSNGTKMIILLQKLTELCMIEVGNPHQSLSEKPALKVLLTFSLILSSFP